MTKGRTFYSPFKCSGSNDKKSSHSAFTARFEHSKPEVVMIIIDEISMLKAEFIVLLDERIKSLYNSSKPFGGKSILMVSYISS